MQYVTYVGVSCERLPNLLVGEECIGRMRRILLDMALDAGGYRRFPPFGLRRRVCCARLHVRLASNRSASWEGQPLRNPTPNPIPLWLLRTVNS